MTDKIHLDELVTASSKELDKNLLGAFRDAVRDPNTSQADYATRLKTVMEEALIPEAADAPSEPHD